MSGSDGINQRDADVIAKAIRNNIDLSASQKEGVAIDIANYLLRYRNQFFNKTRFVNMCKETFPDGWPNQVDRKWKELK